MLSLSELGTAFQYQVASRQAGIVLQLTEDINGQLAAARTKLQDIPTNRLKHRATTVRQTLAKQWRNFRCRDEVSTGTELSLTGTVIAKTRCIET